MLVGLATAVLLLVGSIFSMLGNPGLGRGRTSALTRSTTWPWPGNLAGCVLGLLGSERACWRPEAPRGDAEPRSKSPKLASDDVGTEKPRPSLADLAMLAFVASLVFMSFEMVAGRLVQRYMGSSIYGWTSVIGVLARRAFSFGNFLGARSLISSRTRNRRAGCSWRRRSSR